MDNSDEIELCNCTKCGCYLWLCRADIYNQLDMAYTEQEMMAIIKRVPIEIKTSHCNQDLSERYYTANAVNMVLCLVLNVSFGLGSQSAGLGTALVLINIPNICMFGYSMVLLCLTKDTICKYRSKVDLFLFLPFDGLMNIYKQNDIYFNLLFSLHLFN